MDEKCNTSSVYMLALGAVGEPLGELADSGASDLAGAVVKARQMSRRLRRPVRVVSVREVAVLNPGVVA